MSVLFNCTQDIDISINVSFNLYRTTPAPRETRNGILRFPWASFEKFAAFTEAQNSSVPKNCDLKFRGMDATAFGQPIASTAGDPTTRLQQYPVIGGFGHLAIWDVDRLGEPSRVAPPATGKADHTKAFDALPYDDSARAPWTSPEMNAPGHSYGQRRTKRHRGLNANSCGAIVEGLLKRRTKKTHKDTDNFVTVGEQLNNA
jgi:hypothetical protein